MVSTIEYALLAGASYRDTRADLNRFPIPSGWSVVSIVPEDNSTGFEASAYRNLATNEIVISFAGTDPNDILGDMAANLGLATGVGSAQLLQAAEYYLQVKAANPNPNATIAFTGHSLGGGLAALMGVFFGKQAVTFDEAPFAESATPNFLPPDVAANLKAALLQNGHTELELAPLTDYLAQRAVAGGIPHSDMVSGIAVSGELLFGFPYNVVNRIGLWTNINHNAPGVSGEELHSQALLTAFLQSKGTAQSGQALNDVTFKLTDLMGMMFDSNLYAHPTTDPDNRNFLERLVQNEQGNAMATRFTEDLWKLAQDGGLTMADGPTPATHVVSKALIAFAMQMYYADTANATNVNKELFTEVTGGVQFDRADVASTLGDAKGYTLYFQTYLNPIAFTDPERQLIQSLLPVMRDWYVQAGTGGMNATDSQNRGVFMLGGLGADSLTGGTGADLLVGNAGIDRLNGSGGNDTLLGGTGFDTYLYNTGDGTDTVNDRDDVGRLFVNGQLLSGGVRRAGDAENTFHSTDNLFEFVQSGTTLTINGQLTVTDWQPGELGITLRDLSALPTGTAPVIDYPDNGLATEVITIPATNGPYILERTDAFNYVVISSDLYSDTIDTGIGNDQLYGNGSNDRLYSGEGDDQLFGGVGHDLLEGGGSQDRLYGEDGRDILLGGGGAAALSCRHLDAARGHRRQRCGGS